MVDFFLTLLAVVRVFFRSRHDIAAEILALRQQVRRAQTQTAATKQFHEYRKILGGQIFEEQLDGWYRVPSSGPNWRGMDAFDRWFELSLGGGQSLRRSAT